MTNKAKQIWQFLSKDGRTDLFKHEDRLPELWDENDNLKQDVIDSIVNTDFNKLDGKYQTVVEDNVPHMYEILSKQTDWISFFKK
jgi:hypothetical protein